ncbi:hypothetical protein LXL04_034290 [Taraxacum kok-saghyz]
MAGTAGRTRWWLGLCCRQEAPTNRSCRNVAHPRRTRRKLVARCSSRETKVQEQLAGEGGCTGAGRRKNGREMRLGLQFFEMGYPRDAPATVLFGEWFRFGKPRDRNFFSKGQFPHNVALTTFCR